MKLTLGQTPGRADPTPLNTPGVLSPETAAPPGHMVTQPVTTKTGAWTVLQKHPSPTPGTPSGTWGLLMHMMQTFPMVLQQAGILAVNTLLMTDQPGVTANPTVINFTCTLMLTVQSMADQAVMAGMPIGVRAQGGGRRGQGLTAMTGGLEAATVWKRHQAGWMHEPISQASPDRGVDGLRVIQMWPLLLTGDSECVEQVHKILYFRVHGMQLYRSLDFNRHALPCCTLWSFQPIGLLDGYAVFSSASFLVMCHWCVRPV